MDFTAINPCLTQLSFYDGNQQSVCFTQNSFSYPSNDIQFQMMILYQQNQYLQQQMINKKYNQFLLQQMTNNEIIPNVKVQEGIKVQKEHTSESSREETNKSQHQNHSLSKEIFKFGNKIKKNKVQKNETKNIPKNYGKAILTFIENNKEIVRKVLLKYSQITYISFMNTLRSKKNKINSIADLRNFWLSDEEKDFSKIVRILSNIFLRYFSLEYIFNSRISNHGGHVKYRTRLIEALRRPQQFTSIKQY